MWTASQALSEGVAVVLQRKDCLDLLSNCTVASLACTVAALPTVLPVGVHVATDGLRIVVPDGIDEDRLANQVVALGAAVPATARTSGWWVVVRGELRQVTGSRRVLFIEAFDMNGRALPAAPRGRWWRC